MHRFILLLGALIRQVESQSFATLQPEIHPAMGWELCSSVGCAKQNGSLVLDAEWRWIHEKASLSNCFEQGHWVDKGYPNKTLCPDDETCTANCALEGSDYRSMGVWPVNDTITYGSSPIIMVKNIDQDDSLKYYNILDYAVSKGSRSFMMRPDGKQYNLFKLLNKEVSFNVDVSKMPCGISADLKFVAMDADGGFIKYKGNRAGAAYGTGYCDASCPRDLRFINGQVRTNEIMSLLTGIGFHDKHKC
jgi:cellulose 1,4-beta-cellobiosidase